MSAHAQKTEQDQLTSANLDAQDRQLADLNINDAPAPAMSSPTSMAAELPAAPNAEAPVGQRSESYLERSTHQKKRKYSAELYQFHKGAWDDFKKRQAAGETTSSDASSTESELSKSPF